MEPEKYAVLRDRLRNYANVNAQDFYALRENLTSPGNQKFLDLFQAELLEVVQGNTMPRPEFEALTDDEFEDDAEYEAHVKAIYAFLFEGGAYP